MTAFGLPLDFARQTWDPARRRIRPTMWAVEQHFADKGLSVENAYQTVKTIQGTLLAIVAPLEAP